MKSGADLRRRSAFRTERDRVLIVSEGSKTEPDYFRRLIQELGLTTAKVRIVGDGGSAPISVVDDTKRFLAKDDDFEQVYCVFDRDRHPSYDEALEAVESLASSKGFDGKIVLAIPSVPCFELWYLIHVSDSRKPYDSAKTGGSPADALLSELKKNELFGGYAKSGCNTFYGKIAPQRSSAKKRARKFLKEARRESAPEFHENPSTRVHLLVEALEKLAQSESAKS